MSVVVMTGFVGRVVGCLNWCCVCRYHVGYMVGWCVGLCGEFLLVDFEMWNKIVGESI
jgi:hypothetical protein